jgi:hypothetical protein
MVALIGVVACGAAVETPPAEESASTEAPAEEEPAAETTDSTPTETPLPTLESMLTETMAALDVGATATAAAFDAEATRDSATATAGPSNPVAVALVSKTFTITDEAGAVLGDGEVRLYAPSSMALDETVEVRVEIMVNAPIAASGTLNPVPSPTPALDTPRPTPTPLPLVERQYVAVREYMGAGLRGPDVAHFEVESVPPHGLRRMQPGATNWWKWNLRPTGPEAAGVNRLEVYIFLPRTRDDGTPFNEETNLFPFEITVKRTLGSWLVDTTLGEVAAIAGAIAAIGGAIGTLYAGAKSLRRRVGQKQTGRRAR